MSSKVKIISEGAKKNIYIYIYIPLINTITYLYEKKKFGSNAEFKRYLQNEGFNHIDKNKLGDELDNASICGTNFSVYLT